MREELQELGADVFCAGLQDDCDITFAPEEYSLTNILKSSPFHPDIIIFMDSIERVIPSGLENPPVPMAAYFIDSSINRFFQRPLAHLFELVLTDQKADCILLHEGGVNTRWFPLTADTRVYHPYTISKKFDLTFVGSRNPVTRIKRENILRLLERNFDLKVFSGDPYLSASETAEVYSQSRLVLNENLFPAVNLRLFEAMACGTVVLTEENDAGVFDLFRDGEHLVTYNPDNLVERVKRYLEDDDSRERIAENARRVIIEHHSMRIKAVELLKLLGDLIGSHTAEADNMSRWERLAKVGEALLLFHVKWHKRDPTALKRAKDYLDASLNERPNADAFLHLGMLYSLTGDHGAAEMCFQGATRLSPNRHIWRLSSCTKPRRSSRQN